MVHHISAIGSLYSQGYYTDRIESEYKNKVPENHVFDEELSVRRNREMAIEHNAKVEEERAAHYKRQSELDKRLKEDVIAYILDNYDLTPAQAKIVEHWVYVEKHSYMMDYFSNIDVFAAFADEIVNGNGDLL